MPVTTTRDVVVVGASAGGVSALERFVSGLPDDLAATVLVVLHISNASSLDRILARQSSLKVKFAVDGDPLDHGTVLVAPPSQHLLVADDHVELSAGPRENGHRPSVDVLFRTAAHALGPRVLAVVLSGTLDDGVAGAAAVRRRGGLVFTQVAEDCLYPAMPENTRLQVGADATSTADHLGRLVAEQATHPVDADTVPAADDILEREALAARNRQDAIMNEVNIGPASGFGCPNCGGVLFTVPDDAVLRFRCRIGHGWTAAALHRNHDESTESALGAALRALEEKSALSRRLADRAEAEGRPLSVLQFREAAESADRSAKELNRLVETFAASHEADRDEGVLVDPDEDVALMGTVQPA